MTESLLKGNGRGGRLMKKILKQGGRTKKLSDRKFEKRAQKKNERRL